MDRRELIQAGAVAALFWPAAARAQLKPEDKRERTGDDEITPGEDLMREHGVLNRILLVYDEGARRLRTGDAPIESLDAAAAMIERFVEGYHEKLEEEHLFPRLERGEHAALCKVLREQHAAGRRVTAHIRTLCRNRTPSVDQRESLATALLAFQRMYRPHEAREDTVIFPAFADSMSAKAYKELGEEFEKIETKKVGEKGFEKAVVEIAQIERALDIHDLARFTPK
jgi:hemerythrin-like domain-containing protein